MITSNASLHKSVDWVIIALYLALLVCGWFSVCGASYTYGEPDFLGMDTRAGTGAHGLPHADAAAAAAELPLQSACHPRLAAP